MDRVSQSDSLSLLEITQKGISGLFLLFLETKEVYMEIKILDRFGNGKKEKLENENYCNMKMDSTLQSESLIVLESAKKSDWWALVL